MFAAQVFGSFFPPVFFWNKAISITWLCDLHTFTHVPSQQALSHTLSHSLTHIHRARCGRHSKWRVIMLVYNGMLMETGTACKHHTDTQMERGRERAHIAQHTCPTLNMDKDTALLTSVKASHTEKFELLFNKKGRVGGEEVWRFGRRHVAKHILCVYVKIS